MAPKFTTVTSQQASKTLARKFIPLADSLRNMLTKFGLRAYRVTMVRIRWSDGARGAGTPTVELEEVMLPTPKIGSLDGLTEINQPIGLDEQGSIELSQISGRFTEEQLLGLEADGREIDPEVEFFYEVEFFPATATEGSHKRRFYPRSAPVYMPGRLQWSLRLEKGNADRERNGDPGW